MKKSDNYQRLEEKLNNHIIRISNKLLDFSYTNQKNFTILLWIINKFRERRSNLVKIDFDTLFVLSGFSYSQRPYRAHKIMDSFKNDFLNNDNQQIFEDINILDSDKKIIFILNPDFVYLYKEIDKNYQMYLFGQSKSDKNNKFYRKLFSLLATKGNLYSLRISKKDLLAQMNLKETINSQYVNKKIINENLKQLSKTFLNLTVEYEKTGHKITGYKFVWRLMLHGLSKSEKTPEGYSKKKISTKSKIYQEILSNCENSAIGYSFDEMFDEAVMFTEAKYSVSIKNLKAIKERIRHDF